MTFSSRSATPTERKYASIEKEASTIIEAVNSCSHLSLRQFTIVTDQQAVDFMSHTERPGKIRNYMIQRLLKEL